MTSRQVLSSVCSLFFAVVIDQGSKYVAHDVVLNPGISFGLLPGPLLTIGLIIVLLLIMRQFGRDFLTSSPIAAGVFFGASISNIIDRLLFGGVRDFLSIPFFDVRNNLADWAIILCLMWLFFRSREATSIK